MSDTIALFVYGSFTEGMIHRSHLSKYIDSSESAHVKGHCYLMPVGYPAVLEATESNQINAEPTNVPGELLKISAPDIAFQLLDEFHGVSHLIPEKGLHFKKNVDVITASGIESAWVYFINPQKMPKNSKHIINGDWKAAMENAQSLIELLGPNHIEYIRKLGGVKGRSLIPYDLELSRELMKLDVIVDKGRRLALTKFGRELLRYLPE